MIDGVPQEGTTPAQVMLEAQGEGDTAAVRIVDVQLMPRLLHRVQSYYPHKARERGIGGKVVVRCEVGEDGRCREIDAVEDSPPRDFRIAATEALRRWRFEPQRVGGVASGTVLVPFAFHLGRITHPDETYDTQRMESLQRAAAFRLKRRLGDPTR